MNAPVNELQVIEQNAIIAAFAQVGGTDELFDRIAQEARSFVPDVTTKKGRDEIGSLAMKVSKSKTLIEKYGKELVAEQKAQIKLVDDDRISVVKKFDALRDEILAPRDAWEQAEEDRVAKHQDVIESIKSYAAISSEATSSDIREVASIIENTNIDSSLEEFEQEAKIAKLETLEKLRTALVTREKYEAEQAELERLRKAEAERQQLEREEQIKREAAEAARIEAENKARFEAEKVQREMRESAEREARLVAEKEAAELRAKHAAQEERERAEREQAAKIAAEQKAEADRLANVEHVKAINNEALNAIVLMGFSEEQAKAVITAIAKNRIPHILIKY
jgi:hypothetical protein